MLLLSPQRNSHSHAGTEDLKLGEAEISEKKKKKNSIGTLTFSGIADEHFLELEH